MGGTAPGHHWNKTTCTPLAKESQGKRTLLSFLTLGLFCFFFLGGFDSMTHFKINISFLISKADTLGQVTLVETPKKEKWTIFHSTSRTLTQLLHTGCHMLQSFHILIEGASFVEKKKLELGFLGFNMSETKISLIHFSIVFLTNIGWPPLYPRHSTKFWKY